MGVDPYYNHYPNNLPRLLKEMKMGDSIIKDVYVGKYVLVQLVDETVELTVENNVYSLTEATELEQDILKALYTLRKQNILKESEDEEIEEFEHKRFAMQPTIKNKLESIDE
jgi:hypothetical protein